MKEERIKCPCGCESELLIGIAEEGDYFEDVGKILIGTCKQGQKGKDANGVVITKEILEKLNKIYEERE